MVVDDFLFLCFTLYFLFCQRSSIVTHTITSSQPLTDGYTIVSQGGTFELGFFSPADSKNCYEGLWNKKISVQRVVWVLNKNMPINDSSGVFKMEKDGNLVLLDREKNVVWSTNSSKSTKSSAIELLDSRNLVLQDANECNSTIWQSFNYPSDVLLPGMKIRWDLKTGLNRVKCLKNCSCMAYTNTNISSGGSGCVIWPGNLVDIRKFKDAGQDLYIRMPASELGGFTTIPVELESPSGSLGEPAVKGMKKVQQILFEQKTAKETREILGGVR
ncbi:hypothetical protein GIB67_009644 [Kingdonia uniflora]|uniref:Bulb-type lectin domain-containing protein n=1 Tax=Kingdonia uniflora TaxID=39325 RepID=A0A7J7M5S3_9MAGN|nr:hypothetical protein GIB67_009644 [Kingdonia uniflora]